MSRQQDGRSSFKPKPGATKTVIIMTVLLVITIVMLYPFYFMIEKSFQPSNQFQIGEGFSLISWQTLFQTIPVFRQLLNSTIVTICAIVIILIASSGAGYAFSKLKYPGSNTLFLLVVGSMMIPMQTIIIPEFVNLAALKLINHLTSAILVYAAIGTPFGTFLITSYLRGIPEEMMDAGVVDGASYYGIYHRIMLPMAVPALITIAVLQFIQIWDDLLVGLLFLQTPVARTITVGLATLQASHITQIPVLMGGALLSALPAAILYLLFQRYIVSGLTMGMSK